MAKRLSLEEQADILEREEIQWDYEKEKRLKQFTWAQQAFEAIERIYKESRREWAYAQRAHVKTVRKYVKVMNQLKDAGGSTQASAARKRGSLVASPMTTGE